MARRFLEISYDMKIFDTFEKFSAKTKFSKGKNFPKKNIKILTKKFLKNFPKHENC